eukprot:CAMPEP_0119031110 /NCGR_PEP_ID=MMETSP1176-20130426/41373_1 /TAXON_ID=265551 /ORGANISM="Synedropsis recta cf, Strain CCMP1620" /LENGTH=500 /DNA_ID=CAMNT_0006987497 /DNA_START=89 /DNA_END=1591 /DNA_ORIENTATION=+
MTIKKMSSRIDTRRGNGNAGSNGSNGSNAGGNNISRFILAALTIAAIAMMGIYRMAAAGDSNASTSSTSTTSSTASNANKYIVVIDAGSSGSRAHVFQYDKNDVLNPKHESLKVKPGLSSYATHAQDAGVSLDPLLTFVRQHVPVDQIKDTKVVLYATAGMRLIGETERTAVMTNVQEYLQKSDFSFKAGDAKVIDGKQEGMLGWLAVNFLNNDKQMSWGVLEMGGASVQFTVPIPAATSTGAATVVPEEHKRSYRATDGSGKQEEVFTHSFLGLGMEAAREAVNQALLLTKESSAAAASGDPCLQASYVEEHNVDQFSGVASVTPAGNFDACSALISKTMFQPPTTTTESNNSNNKCDHPGDGCFYNGMFAPSLANVKFWAFENFFYTPSALGIRGTIVVEDLRKAGQEVCALPWPTVDVDYPKDDQPKDNNEKWCFGAAYLWMFFTQGLGFKPDQQLTVGNSVGENGIDWALGAALQAILEAQQQQQHGGLRYKTGSR